MQFVQKVWSYCPLLFSEIREDVKKSVCRNIPPDKLTASDKKFITRVCDETLVKLVEHLQVTHLVGVGNWTHAIFKRLFQNNDSYRIGNILHPSPASPVANRDFSGTATQQLKSLGVW